MPIDRTGFNAWVDDDGSGTTGTVLDKATMAEDILDPIDAAIAASAIGYTAGSWTPVLASDGSYSGQVYAVQSGSYRKLGTLVSVVGQISLTAKGTLTGFLMLGGLPFANGPVFSPIVASYFEGLAINASAMGGFVGPSASAGYLTTIPAGGGLAHGLTIPGQIGDTFSLMFAVTYHTAS